MRPIRIYKNSEEKRKIWREYARKRRQNPEQKKKHAESQLKYRKKKIKEGTYGKWYRGNRTAQTRRWSLKNKEKKSAHMKVHFALKNGEIKKLPCCICGTTNFVCGHHEDYSKPLEVVWLCNLHHVQYHKGLIKKEALKLS